MLVRFDLPAVAAASLFFFSRPSLAVPAFKKRASTVLADGESYQSGAISASLIWQSSGVLRKGCPKEVGIENCYTGTLSSSGDLQSRSLPSSSHSAEEKTRPSELLLIDDYAAHDDDDLDAHNHTYPDSVYNNVAGLEERQVVVRNCSGGGGVGGVGGQPSPRQRIELFTWPGAVAGTTWKYTWKGRTSRTSTSDQFFHVWQILRRDACGGPVVTLDLNDNQIKIRDLRRGCNGCVSAPASSFFDRTVTHTLTVIYGLDGALKYTATVPDGSLGLSKKTLLSYSAKGDMGHKASLKFGSYRAVVRGMRSVTTWMGDFSAKQLK
ncbi:hypothetical protein JCM8547_001939 [Rhodosporidiobolus lusitaniae]